jgi:hypothetical protein
MNEVKVKSKEPIFVVGFPKSGNTWLARLLAELTQSNIAVNNSSDAVNMADNSSKRKGCYIIHKEHVVNNVEEVLQGRVVYIVRDVRDVLVSGFFHNNRWCNNDLIKRNILYRWYFNHEVRKLNEMWRGNIWAEFRLRAIYFFKFLISYKFKKISIGNWSDHVTFWSRNQSVVIVKYENLLHDVEKEMKRILSIFEIDVSGKVLQEAISNQSFKKKKSEFLRSGDSQNLKFLRSGTAGGWRYLFSPAMVKEIEIKHELVMNRCGYKIEYCEGKK